MIGRLVVLVLIVVGCWSVWMHSQIVAGEGQVQPELTLFRSISIAIDGLEQTGIVSWNSPRRSVESVIAVARYNTGLQSLGDHEDEFRRNLKNSLDAVHASNGTSNFAKQAIHDKVAVEDVEKRLRFVDTLATFPEISKVTLPHSVFIIGAWRTGSTLLHHLLAQDPGTRSIKRWEMLRPIPPPTNTTHRQVWLDTIQTRLVAPSLHLHHQYEADMPEEDWAMWTGGHLIVQLTHLLGMEAAMGQYLDSAQAFQYETQRQMLQLLTWRHRAGMDTGSYLVLKCPMLTYHLESIAQVFALEALEGQAPTKTTFVWLHRDPRKVVASLANLMLVIREPFQPSLAPTQMHDIGRVAFHLVKRLLDAGVSARARLEAGGGESRVQFVDVGFKELMSDKISTVAKLYTQMGVGFTPEVKESMETFLRVQGEARKTQGQPKKYSLEEFGLSDERVNDEFAVYNKRFAVVSEIKVAKKEKGRAEL
jgi:hypothetical protein